MTRRRRSKEEIDEAFEVLIFSRSMSAAVHREPVWDSLPTVEKEEAMMASKRALNLVDGKRDFDEYDGPKHDRLPSALLYMATAAAREWMRAIDEEDLWPTIPFDDRIWYSRQAALALVEVHRFRAENGRKACISSLASLTLEMVAREYDAADKNEPPRVRQTFVCYADRDFSDPATRLETLLQLFGVSKAEFASPQRKTRLVAVRSAVAWCMRYWHVPGAKELSWPKIRLLAYGLSKGHSTVMTRAKKIADFPLAVELVNRAADFVASLGNAGYIELPSMSVYQDSDVDTMGTLALSPACPQKEQ